MAASGQSSKEAYTHRKRPASLYACIRLSLRKAPDEGDGKRQPETRSRILSPTSSMDRRSRNSNSPFPSCFPYCVAHTPTPFSCSCSHIAWPSSYRCAGVSSSRSHRSRACPCARPRRTRAYTSPRGGIPARPPVTRGESVARSAASPRSRRSVECPGVGLPYSLSDTHAPRARFRAAARRDRPACCPSGSFRR